VFVDEPITTALSDTEKLSMIRWLTDNVSLVVPLTSRDSVHQLSWTTVLVSHVVFKEPVHPIYHWIEQHQYSKDRHTAMTGTVSCSDL